jgi:16S rRNA (uracil1498-N3)-methyltransferase
MRRSYNSYAARGRQESTGVDHSTMISRFFCAGPLRTGTEIALPREVAHHAERVLRLAVGEELVLFDGNGAEFAARLTALGAGARAEITERREPLRESPVQLTLVQALASGDKMDWVIQKAVELGVGTVIPVAAERCVLKLVGDRADKRLSHWRQVAVSACEQCGRNRIPEIAEVQPLTRYLTHRDDGVLRLLLNPLSGQRLAELPRPTGTAHVLIGPEGGWAETELKAMRAAGCTPVRLGPRVLRTETAGLAVIAALQTLWGDF